MELLGISQPEMQDQSYAHAISGGGAEKLDALGWEHLRWFRNDLLKIYW